MALLIDIKKGNKMCIIAKLISTTVGPMVILTSINDFRFKGGKRVLA
jgi:hypothetical protein